MGWLCCSGYFIRIFIDRYRHQSIAMLCKLYSKLPYKRRGIIVSAVDCLCFFFFFGYLQMIITFVSFVDLFDVQWFDEWQYDRSSQRLRIHRLHSVTDNKNSKITNCAIEDIWSPNDLTNFLDRWRHYVRNTIWLMNRKEFQIKQFWKCHCFRHTKHRFCCLFYLFRNLKRVCRIVLQLQYIHMYMWNSGDFPYKLHILCNSISCYILCEYMGLLLAVATHSFRLEMENFFIFAMQKRDIS